jgi:hypothetical protein
MMLLPNTRLNAAIQHLVNEEQKKTHKLSDEFLRKLSSGEIIYGRDNSDVPLINAIACVNGLRALSSRLGLSGQNAHIKPRALQRQLKRIARELAFYTAEAKDRCDNSHSDDLYNTYANFEEARVLVFGLLNPTIEKISIFQDMPSWDELYPDEAPST